MQARVTFKRTTRKNMFLRVYIERATHDYFIHFTNKQCTLCIEREKIFSNGEVDDYKDAHKPFTQIPERAQKIALTLRDSDVEKGIIISIPD